DDGVRLTINGTQIINDWGTHPPTTDSGTITLQGGKKYPITMDYFQDSGGSQISLSWSAIGIPQELVPSTQLFFTFHNGK
ncbi:MAG TPA: PA14 domain-containing protein, partial [Verrucomicrobiae bacterium]|nr:PA14 domain-containing protein [Verrucomicrobiae bacterium]